MKTTTLTLSDQLGPNGNRVLVLKKKAEEPKPPVADDKRKAVKDARTWMIKTYPVIAAYLPLKLGAGKEIVAEGMMHGHRGNIISKAIRRHTSCLRYLKSIAEDGSTRHAMTGEAVEPVSDEHRAYARQRLAEIDCEIAEKSDV